VGVFGGGGRLPQAALVWSAAVNVTGKFCF